MEGAFLMKRRRGFVLTIVLVLLSPAIVAGQENSDVRVGVLRFVSLESDDRYDVVVSQVTDTVSLTLELLPGYRPQMVDPTSIVGFDTAIPLAELAASVAQEEGFDAVIFGTAERIEPRGTTFRAGVYDPATNNVSVSIQRDADSLLAVFETADELVVELLQEFSGATIRFGTVAIQTNPPNTPVALRIGANTVQPSNGRVNNVLTGVIDAAIVQDRFEPGTVIAEQRIEVLEGRTTTIDVEIPSLLPGEEEQLTDLEQRINDNYSFTARDRIVEDALEELSRLADGPEFSPAIPLLRDRVTEIGHLWGLQRISWDIPYQEDQEADVALAAVLPYLTNGETLPRVREAARRVVSMYAEMQYLAAFTQVSRRNWDAIELHFERIDAVRTYLPTERYREIAETRSRLSRLGEQYVAIEKDGVGVWPWVVAGVGVAALGTGGFFLITDQVGQLNDENDDLYSDYRAATTAAERTDLRDEIEANDTTAGRYQIIQWTSIGVGTAALGVGTYGILRSLRGPNRFYRDRILSEYGAYIDAATTFFSDSVETVAIVTGTDRDITVLLGDAKPQAPPVIAEGKDLQTDTVAPLRIVDTGGGSDDSFDVPINRGRNLFLTYLPESQPILPSQGGSE